MKNIMINNISTSYYITEDGKCYNEDTGKFLTGKINKVNGYLFYRLKTSEGKGVRRYAHRLVAEAFVPAPSPGHIKIKHLDGNKLNNYADNLVWVVSASDAMTIKQYDHIYCFTKDKKLVAEYKTLFDASKAVEIASDIIQKALEQDVKKMVGGFYWSRERKLGEIKQYPDNTKVREVNQYTLKGRYITSYPSIGIAAKAVGGTQTEIGSCCRGKFPSYKGFIWRYTDDIVLTFGENREIKKESVWTGAADGAFFNGESFDRSRRLMQAEYEYSGRNAQGSFYIISADIARKGCDTVVCIFKVHPQAQGPSIKSLVNIYTYQDMHFEDQAIMLKKMFYKYKARRLVIDANGIGMPLIDFMVKSQVDPATGDFLPDFGVYGGTQSDAVQEYKKYRTENTEENAMYLVKAHAAENTECYSITQDWLTSGKIRFLIDEKTAKDKLLGTARGQKMSPEERNDYLRPYVLTSFLREEMLNLRETNEGVNIILKQATRAVPKDKFSAFVYGLFYIKREEERDRKKQKKRFKASEWAFYN